MVYNALILFKKLIDAIFILQNLLQVIKDNTNFKNMDLNDLWLVGDVLFVEVIHF